MYALHRMRAFHIQCQHLYIHAEVLSIYNNKK